MGGANNICSDKTGTLTKNEMTVTTIWAGRSVPVKVNDEKYSFRDYFTNDRHIQLFTQSICLNTVGTTKESSATEMSMLKMMDKFNIDMEAFRKAHLPPGFTRF
jgi:P-type E1-E2 ATPase